MKQIWIKANKSLQSSLDNNYHPEASVLQEMNLDSFQTLDDYMVIKELKPSSRKAARIQLSSSKTTLSSSTRPTSVKLLRTVSSANKLYPTISLNTSYNCSPSALPSSNRQTGNSQIKFNIRRNKQKNREKLEL